MTSFLSEMDMRWLTEMQEAPKILTKEVAPIPVTSPTKRKHRKLKSTAQRKSTTPRTILPKQPPPLVAQVTQNPVQIAPLDIITELFDNTIAPTLCSNNDFASKVKCQIYKSIFIRHVMGEIKSKNSTILDPEQLFLLSLDVFQRLGLISL